MGCQKTVILGQSLTVTEVTHDPDTWAASDADALPTYRIYDREDGTAVVTGTMSLLDDANTTGFYAATIDITIANGFQTNRSYTIEVKATVGTYSGSNDYSFTVKSLLAVRV